ncbi:MAG: hypothetical protein IPH86_12010 [bacterium]|nr:hypothetical protein [bacterium]
MAPAVIEVAPDSVSMVLPAGTSASRVVTISNNGSGALDWSLQQPTTGTGGDLTGLRILWPRGHGEYAAVNWSNFTGELAARGAVVVESDQPVDSMLLAGFDIVYVNHGTTPWETAEAGALVRWLWSGGSLLCETSTTADFTAILAAAETGIAYVASASAGGFTSLLDPTSSPRAWRTFRRLRRQPSCPRSPDLRPAWRAARRGSPSPRSVRSAPVASWPCRTSCSTTAGSASRPTVSSGIT